MSTISYLVRRLALLLMSLIFSSAFVFLLLRLLPGDIAQAKLGIYGTPEALEQLRAEYGLDKSVIEQYLSWVSKAVRGDLGLSVLTGADITQEILAKATVTLPLIGIASVLAITIALPIGMYAALRFRKWDGIATSVVSQLGIAVPTFWVGVILITVLAVRNQVFPSGGFPYEGWTNFPAAINSLVLPTCTLALAQSAVLMRFVRSATIDVIQQDYFRTARATGLSRAQALRVHGVRNAMIPVVSVLGMQISTLIVGAIIVESVFALPGVGQMLLQDVDVRDYTKVQGTIAVTTALVFVVSFIIDLIIGILNPRARSKT